MENNVVLAVVNDIFFSAKISAAAKQAGVKLEYVTVGKNLLEKAAARPVMIVFDLNFEAARPIELIRKLKADPATSQIKLLGYLSHVQVDLQRAAAEAGCDEVMPRSAFSMNLNQILSAVAGTS
jgi:CheY-like chemotaxis protein